MPTFAEAATVIERKSAGWRGRRQPQAWLNSLERYAFPRIGGRPVSEVDSADVLEVLTPIWHTKIQTARAVRQRIRAVMEWAIAMNLRADNPCDRLGPVLGQQNRVVRHMSAVPHREVAAAVVAVRESQAAEAVKLAFEFMVLTAARPGEVRGAVWPEIDAASRAWTIAALRMKATREHRVPLCSRALEVVDAARALGDGGNPVVFPAGNGKPLDEKRMHRALQWGRIAAVPHGFRSSFPGLGGRGDGPPMASSTPPNRVAERLRALRSTDSTTGAPTEHDRRRRGRSIPPCDRDDTSRSRRSFRLLTIAAADTSRQRCTHRSSRRGGRIDTPNAAGTGSAPPTIGSEAATAVACCPHAATAARGRSR